MPSTRTQKRKHINKNTKKYFKKTRRKNANRIQEQKIETK